MRENKFLLEERKSPKCNLMFGQLSYVEISTRKRECDVERNTIENRFLCTCCDDDEASNEWGFSKISENWIQ